MALTLTPEGVVLAAQMMRRGGNRSRVLALIGLAPHDDEHFHQLSTRTAAHYLGVSIRHVHVLFTQLVAAGVLERRLGAGSRGDAWRIRGDVARWAVLWPIRRDVDHVRLILAELGCVIDVELVTPAPIARASIGTREARFARALMGTRGPSISRASSGTREGFGLRAPMEARAIASSSWAGAEGGDGTHQGETKKKSGTDHYVDAMAAVVYRLTGCPVFGRARGRVAALEGQLSLERAEQALTALPAGAKWPVVIETLEHEARSPGRTNGHRATAPDPPPVPLPDPEERPAVRSMLAELRGGRGWVPAGD